ncbi:MAG: hypothetical protein KKD18_04515 [Nanoarchaeota archaeon]|nr:hypothetical protein [Nanoarchaeota archaeon]
MNKRGQFFLVAALVIISIAYGLSMIYTSIETPGEDNSIYDLTKEIKYESGAVVDSGIFNAETEEEMDANVQNLTDHYGSANLGSDLIFIYGNRTNMTALFYTTTDTGSIGVDLGTGTGFTHEVDQVRKFSSTFEIPSEDNSVTIVLDESQSEEVRYTFDVKPGEMFFVILKKEKQGEQFVSANKQ